MTDEPIPEWAWKRAYEMAYGDMVGFDDYRSGSFRRSRVATTLARLIARTEQPPVDPDLLEAREMVAASYGNTSAAVNVRCGNRDWDDRVKIALAAMKRGRELERGK